jgi:hypothetical protein
MRLDFNNALGSELLRILRNNHIAQIAADRKCTTTAELNEDFLLFLLNRCRFRFHFFQLQQQHLHQSSLLVLMWIVCWVAPYHPTLPLMVSSAIECSLCVLIDLNLCRLQILPFKFRQ